MWVARDEAYPLKEERGNTMAKPVITDEVQVLRFFEVGPIEKVEVVYNIVVEKMRDRLSLASDNEDRPSPLAPRKRAASGSTKTQTGELGDADTKGNP
jgi:hypothetical protein